MVGISDRVRLHSPLSRKGSANGSADCVSRLPLPATEHDRTGDTLLISACGRSTSAAPTHGIGLGGSLSLRRSLGPHCRCLKVILGIFDVTGRAYGLTDYELSASDEDVAARKFNCPVLRDVSVVLPDVLPVSGTAASGRSLAPSELLSTRTRNRTAAATGTLRPIAPCEFLAELESISPASAKPLSPQALRSRPRKPTSSTPTAAVAAPPAVPSVSTQNSNRTRLPLPVRY